MRRSRSSATSFIVGGRRRPRSGPAWAARERDGGADVDRAGPVGDLDAVEQVRRRLGGGHDPRPTWRRTATTGPSHRPLTGRSWRSAARGCGGPGFLERRDEQVDGALLDHGLDGVAAVGQLGDRRRPQRREHGQHVLVVASLTLSFSSTLPRASSVPLSRVISWFMAWRLAGSAHAALLATTSV